jgi:predicted lysophospholipase L1 biosynthesis ABC-type transport system permease subunit
MLVAQRTRELGLLRALGASRGQITRSVLLEALVVGVIGSVVGLASGVGVAVGLQALINATGAGLPEGDLVFQTSTVVWSFAVGIGVTTVAAVLPARRASRIRPSPPCATTRGCRAARSGAASWSAARSGSSASASSRSASAARPARRSCSSAGASSPSSSR